MSIKSLIESTENFSLRKLALTTEVSYQMLLKASKKPITGVAYDPKAVNYDEIEKLLKKHNVEIEKLNAEDFVSESKASALKSEELKLGQVYKIRNNEAEWTVMLLTKECVCIQSGEQLRTMSIATFLHQTPKIVENNK